MNSHQLQLYDIITIRSPHPGLSALEGRQGIVMAIRRSPAATDSVAVLVCPIGVGFGCPDAETYALTSNDVVPSGCRYHGGYYIPWDPLSQSEPQFVRYEKVIIRSSESAISKSNGAIGVIAMPPEKFDGQEWRYTVRMPDATPDLDLFEHEMCYTGDFDPQYSLELDHPPAFAQSEIVTVAPEHAQYSLNDDRSSIVLGRNQQAAGIWNYLVDAKDGRTSLQTQARLTSLGSFVSSSMFNSGRSLTVRVE
jgi:hypothetical protein